MAGNLEYDIFTNISETTPVSFEAGELKQIEKRDAYCSGCRVFLNGKIGFSSTTDKNDNGLLERAKASAEFGRDIEIELPTPKEYPKLAQFFEETAKLKTHEMIEIGSSLVAKLKRAVRNPDVKINVDIRKIIDRYDFKNSKGIEASYDTSIFSITFFITHSKEGDILWLFDEFSSYKIDEIKVDDMVNKIILRYQESQSTGELKTGKYPMIFTPVALPQFLVPLLHCINGENIEKGMSVLKNKKGQKIFDDRITIIDEQIDKKGVNSRPFDGEGLPSRELTLVENGLLKSYTHTLSTAKKIGDEATASALRDGSSLPRPSTTNLKIMPGATSIDDMMGNIEKGVIVYFLSGIGQSNMLAGEFQNGLYLGFLIKNGRVESRLKNVMLSGNIFDAMSDVGGISKEVEFIFGYAFMPYILLNNISISGS